MGSGKGNKWIQLVDDMCSYKKNPVPEMKHGGNHHEWAEYDLTSYQKKGEKRSIDAGDGNTYTSVEGENLVLNRESDARDYLNADLLSKGWDVRHANEIQRNIDLGYDIGQGQDNSIATDGLYNHYNKDFRIDQLANTNEYLGRPSHYNNENFLTKLRMNKGYFNNVLGVSIPGHGISDEYNVMSDKWRAQEYPRIYYGSNLGGKKMRFPTGDDFTSLRQHELGHAMLNNTQAITPYASELLRRSKTFDEDRSDVSFKEWKETEGLGKRSFGEWGSDLLKGVNLKSGDSRREQYRDWKNTSSGDYLTDDSEVYVRYKAAQRQLKEAGIFDHTTGKPFTEEDYNKVQEYIKSNDFRHVNSDIKQFFGFDNIDPTTGEYNKKIEKEDLMEIFNNVADASDGSSSVVMAEDGTEVEEVEFVQDRFGHIDTEGMDYTSKQLYPFIKDKYTKRNTSDIQQNLLNKLSSQTFRDRYRKNIFNMTGKNLSEEELTNRINDQYDFSAAGAPFHLTFPYVSHSPQGYRRGNTPYVHPYVSDKDVEFRGNTLGLYTENPYWKEDSFFNNEGQGFFDMDKNNVNMPEMLQYSFVPHLFNERDPMMMGDNQIYPNEDWYDTAVHEYAHSYNVQNSSLFKPEGDLYRTYPSKISGNTDDGWYDVPGEKYKTWLTGLFGEDYWDPSKNEYGKWAMKPWEISSIRAENEDKLRRFGVWDNTKEPFSADKHLNLMLKVSRNGDLSNSAEGYHLQLMGFNDLNRMQYDLGKIKKNQKRIIEDWDWNIEAGRKGKPGDYINNRILDFNDKLTNLRNDSDASSFEIKKLENQQVMDMNTFNELFNSSQSDLDEKHRYDDYNSLIEHVNLKGNVFNKKKKERANKVLDLLYDKVREQLEVNPELDDIQNQFDKKKKEVGPKLEMYFNEIAQNEGEEQPVMAKFGAEMDTDQVVDKYDLQTAGLEEGDIEWQDPPTDASDEDSPVATKHGGELSVWNREKYSTPAKMFKKGGENKNKLSKEERAKHRSYTGDWYVGSLDEYRIDDLFDFSTGKFKDGYSADDPEVLKWRSSKGFTAMDLLNWYYLTQYNIPYNTNIDGVTNVIMHDKSTWADKNYGYITSGRSFGSKGEPGNAFESESFYPKDHSQAHAMSRDLRGVMGGYFFFDGIPFTNEEGDEKSIRLGLKPGAQMQELESRLKSANSKSEVTKIMKEFYKDNGKHIDLESFVYMNNIANPFKLDQRTLMKVNELINEYRDGVAAEELSLQFDKNPENLRLVKGEEKYKHDGETVVISDENKRDYETRIGKIILDSLPDGSKTEDVRLYIHRLLDGEMDNYVDDYVMSLADHSSLATFGSKKEFNDWTNSEEFKNGFWDPQNISYIGKNGEIVSGKDIKLPYNTMYNTYKPYGFDQWPTDNNGNTKLQINSEEEALQSNAFPLTSISDPQTLLGQGVSYLSNLFGGDDVNISPHDFGLASGADFQGMVPDYNPFEKTFEWYEYDEDGMVTKTHEFANPGYNSEEAKLWRKILGPKGDGVGGTITTNLHGNNVLNLLAVDNLVDGAFNNKKAFALNQNPYYTDQNFMTNQVRHNLQPHQFMYMDNNEINDRFLSVSGKNVNPYSDWSGAAWLSGVGSAYQLGTSGLLQANAWKGGFNQIGNYFRNPGKWGYVGATVNSLGVPFRGAMNTYDKTSLGKMTKASLPGTGGLVNINNTVIGNWAYDELTGSYKKFSEGDILGGTGDLAFGALNTGLLYNRAKNAYTAQNWLNYGKFPNLTNINKIGNVNINPQIAGPTSQFIRQNIPAWSLRNQTNRLFNRNLFSPQLTQPKLTAEFKNLLQKQQMNQYGDFSGVVPKFNLLPPNYKIGDLNKNKIITE